MKNSLFLVPMAVLVACAGCFVGCNGDDDDGNGGGLPGTWRLTSIETGGMTIDPSSLGMTIEITINENGTFTLQESEPGETYTETGTWSATDTQLTITTGGEADTMDYDLSGDTLRIHSAEFDDVEADLVFTRV